jgi:hypothetical protein
MGSAIDGRCIRDKSIVGRVTLATQYLTTFTDR